MCEMIDVCAISSKTWENLMHVEWAKPFANNSLNSNNFANASVGMPSDAPTTMDGDAIRQHNINTDSFQNESTEALTQPCPRCSCYTKGRPH